MKLKVVCLVLLVLGLIESRRKHKKRNDDEIKLD